MNGSTLFYILDPPSKLEVEKLRRISRTRTTRGKKTWWKIVLDLAATR
jgi:hypothetical protein